MPIPQRRIYCMVQSHLEYDPEALPGLPPQAERRVHVPTRVAGLRGKQEHSGWCSRWARALHWVVYGWGVNHMGKNSYFAPYGDHLCCLTPLLPDLPCSGLVGLFGLWRIGESDLPQQRCWWRQLRPHCSPSFVTYLTWHPLWRSFDPS